MKIVNVVLSGGVGSRLWPLSRKARPKQYLNLVGEKSLFQQTVLRNALLATDLVVVGNVDNASLSRQQLLDIGIDNYIEIIEATPRNTAAAIAFAALSLDVEDILIVTPSDHLIEDIEIYHQCLNQAINLAKQDAIVTFGLKPTKPETGYGYIQVRNHEVLGFREKPDEQTAKAYIETGEFYWNSGMFCFKAGVFLKELEQYEPEVFLKSKEAFAKIKNGQLPLEDSLAIPSISVDYAVMERSRLLKAVVGTFQWSDMGSFESVYEYLLKKGYKVDAAGNIVIGTNLHTAFLGLEGCILVYTDDAILVMKKEAAQQVKGVYEALEKNNPLLS